MCYNFQTVNKSSQENINNKNIDIKFSKHGMILD